LLTRAARKNQRYEPRPSGSGGPWQPYNRLLTRAAR